MAGMKFLNLKGWHPSNARNQKRIWIAEQKAKQTEQIEREAAAEVRKHTEAQQFQALAAARGDAESARRSEQMQVGFLYAPPPGLAKVDEAAEQEMTEDDAVREFRRKMEKRTTTATTGDDVQRPLERYVGRRPDEMLTIKEQVERFPFLKDAPVEGDYASNVKVNFKPMGRTLRNVKCMRCSEWGHQSGDRECALKDANPHDAARIAREDPMAIMAQLKRDGQLELKQRALPWEMQQSNKPEYEILLSDDDSADREKAFLAGLSTKEKKALLKTLRKQSKKERVSGRDDSSDDKSSSSSDSDDERSRKKRKRKAKHPRREEKRHHRERRLERAGDASDRTEKKLSRHDRRRSRSRSRSRPHPRERESRGHHSDEDQRRHRSRGGSTRSPPRHRRH